MVKYRPYSSKFLNALKSPKLLLALLILTTFTICYFMYLGHRRIQPHGRAILNNGVFHSYDNHPTENTNFFLGERLVHLDLKGAPPKIAYFEQLFPLLEALGATGILLEYEDMFPYTGKIRNISASNCYTKNDISTINALAIKSNLAIIPLVQTFGHMEFVLKLREFSHLREIPEYPQAICPTHEETLDLIVEMLDQIIIAHPQVKLIHIGADEVYNIGQCQRCFDTLSKFNWSKNQLFLKHVLAVARKIKSKYNYLRVLMWDDHFHSMTLRELKENQVAEIVEPIVWDYAKDVAEDLGPNMWDIYELVFPKVWIASAFKGATGSNQYLTNTAYHVQNHRSWLALVEEYNKRINFQGIFLTGWQRYDHFAVLCELLPVAVPSLAMCLRTLFGYNESPLSPPREVVKLLNCEQPYGLMGPAFGTPKCHYPGGDVLEAILRFQQLKQDFETMLDSSRVKGWITDYNIDHSFSNPQHVVSALMQMDHIKEEFEEIDEEIKKSMSEVYDNFTVSEWRETYVVPLEKQIMHYFNAKEKLLSRTSWPKRPLRTEN